MKWWKRPAFDVLEQAAKKIEESCGRLRPIIVASMASYKDNVDKIR